MIRSWKSVELRELFETGSARRIDQKLQKRARVRLDVLNQAKDLRALHLPGYELHKWEGYTTRWSISVSGHWRILFDWINGEPHNVDLAQPH